MSYNFGEIIKKLYFLVSRKPARGLPTQSPPPLRKLPPHIFPVVDGKVRFAVATFTRGIHSREGRGESEVICETMPFNNGSWDRLQTQHKDRQRYSAPLLFRQDLSNSYWWLMANFGGFIWWSEAIKGSQSLQLALSRLHHIQQATFLWTKEVGHSNTCGTVRLCSFPLKTTAAHSLHFQHLMWTRGYYFKTSTVQRSLVSIVHINS